MKKSFLFFSLLVLTIFLSASCVSKKKYHAALDHADRLHDDSLDTHAKLGQCNATLTGLQNDKGNLLNEKSELEKQNEDAINELNRVSSTSKMTIAQQAKRLQDFQNMIQSQRDTMNKLKESIAKALVDFAPDELTVYVKDGKIYVLLEEKLLFKSGSAVVDPKGKLAIGKLANVLNTNAKNINVEIEGYTDNVPIKTAKFEDNWALSVARSTAIARVLIDGYNMDPNRVTASGQGQYHPVQTNDTPEGRQANRRTEIVLSPQLNNLYNIVNY